MKCLVTGASGFIGSHLVKELEARGDEVVKFSLRKEPIGTRFDTDIDYIFHLSAYGNMADQKDLTEIFMSNLFATYHFLNDTKDIPYKAFINVSSSSVLLDHETMYSATKAGAERLCKAFVDEYDKPIVTVRPFSVYGPGEADFRFIPTVFRSCVKGEEMELVPEPVHDWIHVDTLIAWMFRAINLADTFKGTAHNAGTGIGTSNMAIVKMVEKITGKRANYKVKRRMRTFDTDRWVSSTAIGPEITLEEGLRKYYEWYMGRST